MNIPERETGGRPPYRDTQDLKTEGRKASALQLRGGGLMVYPNKHLRLAMNHFGISNIEMAKALRYDPSLISRYLSGQRPLRIASVQLDTIAGFLLKRAERLSDVEWLKAQFIAEGLPTDMATVYCMKQNLSLWLATDAATLRQNLDMNLSDKHRDRIRPWSPPEVEIPSGVVGRVLGDPVFIATELRDVLNAAPRGVCVDIFLSSDQLGTVVREDIAAPLITLAEKNGLQIRMVVCVSGNTQAMSQILSRYMGLLVSGHVQLSVVHGMTQTVTNQMHMMVPNQVALLVTETTGKLAKAIAFTVRDPAFVQEMAASFDIAWRYAQPILNLYDDRFTRNVLEVFYSEFCTPGALDIIKDNLNPIYMRGEEYRRFLDTLGLDGETLAFRMTEFQRFLEGMEKNLQNGVAFREILSLKRLHHIAQNRCCRMAGNYFMENGFVDLDLEGCTDILQGYIRCMQTYPNFRLLILDDFAILNECSCWHLKQNHHIAINYWKQKQPVMVYSDQLMLLREFQTCFDKLWAEGSGGIGNPGHVIAILRDVLGRMA